MSQFELLRNVTIGQYIPTNSVVHQLDPRTKLVAALSFILAVSLTRSIIPLVILFVGTLLMTKVSRVPINYVLRGIILGLPLLAMVFITQLLFQGWTEPAGRVFFEWGWLRITRFSLHLISIGILRIICFIYDHRNHTRRREPAHSVSSFRRALARIGSHQYDCPAFCANVCRRDGTGDESPGQPVR
jgi:energy-coupling factor transport system permease protein